jgi:hypothetical protein
LEPEKAFGQFSSPHNEVMQGLVDVAILNDDLTVTLGREERRSSEKLPDERGARSFGLRATITSPT